MDSESSGCVRKLFVPVLETCRLIPPSKRHSFCRCTCSRDGKVSFCTASGPIDLGFLLAKHKEEKEHKALRSGSDAEQIGTQCAEVSHKPKHPA